MPTEIMAEGSPQASAVKAEQSDASVASSSGGVGSINDDGGGIAGDYANYPHSGIVTPHAHDVLCGRGGGTNNHAGNETFRKLVNEKKRHYLNSSKREKPLVSKSIVEAVRSQHPPGRFLSKNDKTGLWYDIGDQKAREKTSQALREGAPVIRREINTSLALLAAQMSPGKVGGGGQHQQQQQSQPHPQPHHHHSTGGSRRPSHSQPPQQPQSHPSTSNPNATHPHAPSPHPPPPPPSSEHHNNHHPPLLPPIHHHYHSTHASAAAAPPPALQRAMSQTGPSPHLHHALHHGQHGPLAVPPPHAHSHAHTHAHPLHATAQHSPHRHYPYHHSHQVPLQPPPPSTQQHQQQQYPPPSSQSPIMSRSSPTVGRPAHIVRSQSAGGGAHVPTSAAGASGLATMHASPPAPPQPTSSPVATITLGSYIPPESSLQECRRTPAATSFTSSQRPPPVDLGPYGAASAASVEYSGGGGRDKKIIILGEPSLTASSWFSSGRVVPPGEGTGVLGVGDVLGAATARPSVASAESNLPYSSSGPQFSFAVAHPSSPPRARVNRGQPGLAPQQPLLASASAAGRDRHPLSDRPPSALAARGVSVASSIDGGNGGADVSSPRSSSSTRHVSPTRSNPPRDGDGDDDDDDDDDDDHNVAVLSPHHRANPPPPPPDAPPLSEDAEKRLVLSEWVARTVAQGRDGGGGNGEGEGKGKNVAAAPPAWLASLPGDENGKDDDGNGDDNENDALGKSRDAAAYHEAGMLGMDPDDLVDGMAEGRSVAEMVEEYRRFLRASSSRSVVSSSASADDDKDKAADTDTVGGVGDKRKRMAEWLLLPSADKNCQPEKKKVKSVTRMRIESALSSIGAF